MGSLNLLSNPQTPRSSYSVSPRTAICKALQSCVLVCKHQSKFWVQVFLHATTSKKQALHLKMRSLEWWMRRRRMPQGFRHRVRQFERQRWAAMRGVDECKMIQNLPEGLRRDIRYHLCLDLVRQVINNDHDEVLRRLRRQNIVAYYCIFVIQTCCQSNVCYVTITPTICSN